MSEPIGTCSQGSHPLGVRWCGRLWGPVLSVAGLRPALALFVYVFDVFWLLSSGF
ncbi:hypothetical protein [Arthrobacter sp. UYCu723]